MLHTLFEVSWEVCNKVGGIHTVLSTKAKTVAGRYGDDYICLGPWLMSSETQPPFDETPGFEDFAEACRAMGVPVRIGRWRIPGRPRTILVEFSGLFEKKDGILAGLWERHQVNSISGGWDYVEPVLFGHACGMVIEKWWQDNLAPFHGRAVAHFHEWMTSSGMLYLKEHAPAIGTVFTTHATMLGRAVSSTGQSPQDGLMGREPDALAESMGVTAKHSLEGTAARTADVFTTVSEITADEAQVFHKRRAAPILPNGIDLGVIDEIAGEVGRDDARARLANLATKFLGESMDGASMFAISGRYEFVNKGIDLFLDAVAKLGSREGRPVVAWVLVPAGNSGVKKALAERLAANEAAEGALGISTHNLFDEERDPVHVHCRARGLANAKGSRVKVIQVPIYMGTSDDFLQLPYEAVLRAMDLSCFPSFYEPWGYTPEESLAVGVPTITSDYAGFGRWLRGASVGPDDGVYVLSRVGVEYDEVVLGLEDILESFVGADHDRDALAAICRRTAQKTAWSGLVRNYYDAYDTALDVAKKRNEGGADVPAFVRRPPTEVRPVGDGNGGPRLARFSVSATLPKPLRGLERLSRNCWTAWDHEARRLFEEISPVRWEASGHNPIRFLREVFPEDLEARVRDRAFLTRLDAVVDRFDRYVAAGETDAHGAGRDSALSRQRPVAYFSAEFAVLESLRIYSGGLGVLAGDHLKSASDLNVPLVGVGLFYRDGYMRQWLTSGGEQQSEQDPNDPADLPMEALCEPGTSTPLEVSVQLPSSRLVLRAWKVMVGRVPLYLLDSDVPENRPEDRGITNSLYGGDHENRLRQEIVLGRAGVKLLSRLGITPAVWHCNEGHAAFLSLERVRDLIRNDGLTFDEAREVCRATTVFTTHTPVPAGHDRFGEDLMRRYFSDVPGWLGVTWERFFDLGRAQGSGGEFNMTYLAMNFANFINGVSKLHGTVSQGLLHPFWSRLLESEVPVAHVTNGVHIPTWTSNELGHLLRKNGEPLRPEHFEGADAIDSAKLWDIKQRVKKRMLVKVETVLERSFRRRSDRPALLSRMVAGLDPHALYLCFARRFAPYKRAHLLFHDRDRLVRILSNEERPVRILIAGKAHPRDQRGQDILRDIAMLTRHEPFLGKVFFLENYDVDLASHLVQGSDVWVNTPTRPLEASGTSGMKAACNGALNLSIKDGWWVEGTDNYNGWSIGSGRVFDDQKLQDELDATTMYALLEDEILPLYFDQKAGVAHGWIDRVKRSLITIPPLFNTDRMVNEYRERAYEPLAANHVSLAADRHALARSLADRHHRIRRGFTGVRFLETKVSKLEDLKIGDPVNVQVVADLGTLSDSDVCVELVLGHTRKDTDLHKVVVVPLEAKGTTPSGTQSFEGTYCMERCGSFSYGIRLRAREEGPLDFGLKDLVIWS